MLLGSVPAGVQHELNPSNRIQVTNDRPLGIAANGAFEPGPALVLPFLDLGCVRKGYVFFFFPMHYS